MSRDAVCFTDLVLLQDYELSSRPRNMRFAFIKSLAGFTVATMRELMYGMPIVSKQQGSLSIPNCMAIF